MIGGLVLAAGEGRRYGGGKLVAELCGRPLLEHAIEAVLGVPAIERVVVVLGADADEIRRTVDLGGVETVVCDRWDEGIAASLRTGVDALADSDAVVIVLGDQPFITSRAVAAIAAQVDAQQEAARAVYEGRPGHPVLIKRSLYDAVRSLRGDSGARAVIERAGVREVECAHLGRPDDVDTAEDLEAARRDELGRRSRG
jgi:molybdenum cofactor cytidylyltransferase